MKALCWLNHTHLGERPGNLFRKLKHRQKVCVFQGPLSLIQQNWSSYSFCPTSTHPFSVHLEGFLTTCNKPQEPRRWPLIPTLTFDSQPRPLPTTVVLVTQAPSAVHYWVHFLVVPQFSPGPSPLLQMPAASPHLANLTFKQSILIFIFY